MEETRHIGHVITQRTQLAAAGSAGVRLIFDAFPDLRPPPNQSVNCGT